MKKMKNEKWKEKWKMKNERMDTLAAGDTTDLTSLRIYNMYKYNTCRSSRPTKVT